MPFSWRSFLTVVPLRAAIWLRVSPWRTVVVFVAAFDLALRLLRLLPERDDCSCFVGGYR